MTYIRKTCNVHGCTQKRAHKKDYCWQHEKELRHREGIPKETQKLMRSSCCDATCTAGERHEYGEQYCDACRNACMWHMPRNPSPDLDSIPV